jgi:hypothetical protein
MRLSRRGKLKGESLKVKAESLKGKGEFVVGNITPLETKNS